MRMVSRELVLRTVWSAILVMGLHRRETLMLHSTLELHWTVQ